MSGRAFGLLGVVLGAAACGAHGAPRCRTVAGIDRLLGPGKIVLVGEIHGTTEMPQLFVALACNAATRGLEVAVGFEQPARAGELLQAYLSSHGSLSERVAIIAPRLQFGDGTASVAMVDAFESLRKLARRTRRVRAFGFAGGADAGYAETIATAHRMAPQAVVLALMGSMHAGVVRDPDDGSVPAGLLLRQGGLDIASVYVDFTRGAAYNRGVDGPGVHTQPEQKQDGVTWAVVPAESTEYDVAISVGEIHPSFPARR